MKLTVILPVYNSSNYLTACLQSLQEQSYKNFHLIVIDDGSTDNSLEILKKEIKKFTNKVTLIEQKNIGLVKTLNKSIKLCETKYIARMDSDDICQNLRFERQINYLESNPIDICSSNSIFFGKNMSEKKRILPEDQSKIIRYSLFKSPLIHPGVMLDYDKIGSDYYYEEDLNGIEDHALWLKLIDKGYTLGNIQEFLLKYRIHSNSITQISQNIEIKKRFHIVRRMYELHLSRIGLDSNIAEYAEILATISSKYFFKINAENIITEDKIGGLVQIIHDKYSVKYGEGLNDSILERYFLYCAYNGSIHSRSFIRLLPVIKEYMYDRVFNRIS